MIIENVDWQIDSLCNRSCPYCFGSADTIRISREQCYYIIDILKAAGTKQLGITGGEPLLYPFFSDIIEYATKAGLTIYLSTNCDYYKEFSSLIKENVSILGVPLDGSCAKIHDCHRGANSFDSVIYTLNDICISTCKTQLKVGTVITRNNINDLVSIEKTLSLFNEKLLYWKLYEAISYTRNKMGVDLLRPTNLPDISKLGQFLPCDKIVNDTIQRRSNSYFFIKPNGDIFVPVLNKSLSKEIVIGNILKDDLSLINKRFQEYVYVPGYLSPYRYMKNNTKKR